MAPKDYSPKLLTTKASNHLADLHLVLRDLDHVVGCCELILQKGIHPLLDLESMALLDSAAIRYRRCFGKGHRHSLKQSALKSVQGESAKLHKFVLGLADKHVAHSVNGFEKWATVVYVAVDSEGRVTRSGLGQQGAGTLELALRDIRIFQDLVRSLIDDVKEQRKTVRDLVKAEVEAMTDKEIRELPEGFALLEKTVDVAKTRRWPPVRK